ncbi:uncharacterized protein EKO05_0011417 [Ascochyta rabiei]|uniref:Uncharacterized protein n=1 Tax=Didymella rabiei TaxID=5454 RepID=A0A163KAE0_DIDRA|nr:uncharacterized protein EKO05_0011417 [Ascochyta rabiei]KZM26876.1 hypothetical protein ST47_g1963 [Ascochyta rabiei]UPX21223.1 hypothetical protein EKO05_0011417 [Ascochyta rabiei]
MPNPPWQRLTRDQLVTIIGDYYKFLTTFYIPSSALKFPPPGGWPNITPETTKDFPRSPIVVDPLRHLPYIDEKESGNMITHIHYKCNVVDYSTVKPDQWGHEDFQLGASSIIEWIEELRGDDLNEDYDDDDEGYLWYRDESRDKDFDKEENWWNGDDPEEIKLENMVVLADGYESGGRCLVLDVFKGNIHEDMTSCNLLSEVPVEQFFARLKTKLENLEMVPVPGKKGYEGDMYGDVQGVPEVDVLDEPLVEGDPAQQYKRIYRSFGWPGEMYRKEEALVAISAHIQRRLEAEEAWYEEQGSS